MIVKVEPIPLEKLVPVTDAQRKAEYKKMKELGAIWVPDHFKGGPYPEGAWIIRGD